MKLNKKWIAVLLLVVMALCLTACGEKKEEAKPAEAAKPTIVGVWEMEKETLMNYTGMNEEDYARAQAEFGHIALQIEFKADGTYTMTAISGEEKDVAAEYNYTVDGDKISLGGGSGTIKIEGNKMTLTEDGASTGLVFIRK